MPFPKVKTKRQYTVEITRAMFTQESFEVYQKYQAHVHGEKKVSDKPGYERFLCQVPLFDQADAQDEEENKSGSNRNLTKDNLNSPDEFRVLKDEGVWPKYRGGYHMLHRIDGELMAVGVLDYTTEALSSVYLFYNPKYDFLNPGTYCALREIEYCR